MGSLRIDISKTYCSRQVTFQHDYLSTSAYESSHCDEWKIYIYIYIQLRSGMQYGQNINYQMVKMIKGFVSYSLFKRYQRIINIVHFVLRLFKDKLHLCEIFTCSPCIISYLQTNYCIESHFIVNIMTFLYSE